jgi:AraC-like DNA-binding protein
MVHYKSISQLCEALSLPKPAHPLIGVMHVDATHQMRSGEAVTLMYDFYCVAIKRVSGIEDLKMKYGQQPYDFGEGIMSFVAPSQVLSRSADKDLEIKQSGWVLVIHPDFLWNTTLANTIRRYDFWDYAANEALFLSEKEEEISINILQNIQRECNSNIDQFSKQIIISQLESLFSYAERFYNRQFITREKVHHQLLNNLEKVLNDHFNSDKLNGIPTVNDVAASLHVSPKYLGSLLRALTGQNAQQHIHEKLIEKAKEKISTTELSISEIAYELGFEHIQSFSRLFKAKTALSPLEFRRSFKN